MRVRYLRRTRCRMRTGVAAVASLDGLEAAIRTVEARLGETLAPFRAAVERLITMPGVSETEARVIVAEVGPDMTRFPPAGRLEDLGLTVEIRPAA